MQLILLLKWNDAQQDVIYPAKIFECLAARRPVLAGGGFAGVVDQLLDETNASVSGQTKEDIKAIMLRLYQEYKSTGAVSYGGDEAETSKYSHCDTAKKFASVLDSITR